MNNYILQAYDPEDYQSYSYIILYEGPEEGLREYINTHVVYKTYLPRKKRLVQFEVIFCTN